METLDLNNKRKREKLTASEWNSLIDAINLLILRYNLGATIPTKLSQLINDAGFITDISGKADKNDLARVATTGSYNDLVDKPDLPAVGPPGKSAYELAVLDGYVGNLTMWLKSLIGANGVTPHIDGLSGNWCIGAYDTGVHAQGIQGELGILGIQGPQGIQGILGEQGIQGPKGETGDAFTIYEEYASVTLMNADKDNVPVNKFVIINSNVDDPDNSKLFIRTNNLLDYPSGFKLITDLSGAQGIQGPLGPLGPQGEQGVQGIQGELGPQGEQGNPGTNGTNGIDGVTPHIDLTTGNWFIGATNTRVHAQGPQGILGIQGNDGTTPHINPTTKHWMIGTTDTGIVSEGQNGTNGTNGITPHIDSTTGNWFIGTTDTGVHAEGPQGPSVQSDWNQSDNSQLDYIKNKPDIYTKSEVKSITGCDYVEIGGIKWAIMNLGATNITDTGLYFQWADTQGYTISQVGSGSGYKEFGSTDGKYYSHGNYYYSKYNESDKKRIIEVNDDAAKIFWGKKWKIPTIKHFIILRDSTTNTWVTNYQGSGIDGMLFTDLSDSSKTLFFPATGELYEGEHRNVNEGFYWTSFHSKDTTYDWYAYGVHINNEKFNYNSGDYRYKGFAIRAIIDDSELTSAGKDMIDKIISTEYEYVDLGLPSGTLWAKCNVGASSEESYGNYYAYGKGATQYSASDTEYYAGTETILDPSADTATQVMGNIWCMPTKAQVNELYNYTIQVETAINGVSGLACYGTNGNYIFIPFAGYYNEHSSNLSYSGTFAYFWTSSRDSNGVYYLYGAGNGGLDVSSNQSFLGEGYSVRGVINKKAFSGDYNYLANKPIIPLIWRGTLSEYDALSSYDSNTIYIII